MLIETSRSYARGLLRGVRHYVSVHGPWSVFVELRALESHPPPWLKSWRGDGILTRTGSQRMADVITSVNVPTIELRSTRLRHSFPFIGVDNEAVGRIVADHLLERGFRHFALYHLDTEEYFEQRSQSFLRAITAAGYSVSVQRALGHTERPKDWERHQAKLVRWIRGLPKPVGLMACTDQLGFWLLDACYRAGIAVPEDVAVVGVEDDETLCLVSSPPMSSVRFNAEKTGYEAASMLDQMMSGRRVSQNHVVVPPIGVSTRQSSDVVAIANRDVAEAVRFIRHHACQGIDVSDVLRAVPVSRSTIERRMRSILGRSPRSEILRVRLARATELLADTELSIEAIARKVGFEYPQRLCELFMSELGRSPTAYRLSLRGDKKPE
jgi:LacI family transcriptional regulator